MSGQSLLDPIGIAIGQVDLVDRDDDRNAGGLGVADRFESLRHYAVTAATTMTTISVTLAPRARMAVKASWPGVSTKVILPVRHLHLVRTDVLGNSARFAGGDLGFADRVEERGLTVVDVPHDGHDRRPRLKLFLRQINRGDEVRFLENLLLDLVAELVGDERSGVVIDRLIDRGRHAHSHELRHQRARFDTHFAPEIADGNRIRHLDDCLCSAGLVIWVFIAGRLITFFFFLVACKSSRFR